MTLRTESYREGSRRNQPTFRDATIVFAAKRRLGNKRRNSILMTRHYPDLGSESDWLKICLNQSKAPPRSSHVISMEFLQSLLRRHFAGKPVVALRNVGCFLSSRGEGALFKLETTRNGRATCETASHYFGIQ